MERSEHFIIEHIIIQDHHFVNSIQDIKQKIVVKKFRMHKALRTIIAFHRKRYSVPYKARIELVVTQDMSIRKLRLYCDCLQ
jgi:hypothetical protein